MSTATRVTELPSAVSTSIEDVEDVDPEWLANIRNTTDEIRERDLLELSFDMVEYDTEEEDGEEDPDSTLEDPLLESQSREARVRDAIEATEMQNYYNENPLNETAFELDLQRYDSIYVFCFNYAKLESIHYKNFIESLNTVGKVYFARDRALSKIVESIPGLLEIEILLESDDVGVLLTDINKDGVLSKFREYREYDFLKPGQTPMKPLAYGQGDVLPLPMNLCPKLKALGMPVELIDGCIKLTDNFNLCKEGERVSENFARILELLNIKMFSYVLVPLGYWSASTREFEDIEWDRPKSG